MSIPVSLLRTGCRRSTGHIDEFQVRKFPLYLFSTVVLDTRTPRLTNPSHVV
jgi:hypothetical protein